MKNQRPFPIIEYAHKIGKNTADFTATDLTKFIKWWMKQPVRKDILSMKTNGHMFKQKGAQTGRMEGKKGTLVETDKYIDEMNEDVKDLQEEVVAELGLTKKDVEALQWGLTQLFEAFDFSEEPEIEGSLKSIKDALDQTETE